MTVAPLPVGVVGVGSFGSHHARLLADLPGARLAGLFDTDARRARELAAALGTTAFGSLDEMLGEAGAVVVAAPARSHGALGLAAMARGCHVLMEKPLAATVEEAESLVAAARRAGVALQPGHVERFNPVLLAARRRLRGPRRIACRRLAPFAGRGLDVPVPLDLMIHDLDLALWLDGSPATCVEATGVAVLSGTLDAATARVTFASGCVAEFEASRVADRRIRTLEARCAGGDVELDLAGAGPGEAGEGREPLRLELESFVRTVREGGAPAVTAVEGLAAVILARRVVAAVELPQPALAP